MPKPSKRTIGGLLLGGGFLVTAVLGVLGSTDAPPSLAASAVLILVAGGLQGGASWAFATAGKADPSHAASSTRRLIARARLAQEAMKSAEIVFESNASKAELHTHMGRVSNQFGYLMEGFLEGVDDWREFHPSAVIENGDEPADGE